MSQLISTFIASLVLLVSNLLEWANFDAITATFESRTARDPERVTDLLSQNLILKEKLNQATSAIQNLQAAVETIAQNLPDTTALIQRIEAVEQFGERITALENAAPPVQQ